jgi:hypothetical protein
MSDKQQETIMTDTTVFPAICRHTLAAMIALACAAGADAQSARISIGTFDGVSSTFTFEDGLYQTAFAGTPNGFAVGSTSPNFGGSAMATASSTQFGHLAFTSLEQSFTLPTFITSGRLTLDFRGQAFATGQAAAAIGFNVFKFAGPDFTFLGGAGALSSEIEGSGGKVGSVRLSARRTYVLRGGEQLTVNIQALAETGSTPGASFYSFEPGPGYATAFMDPIVSFTAGVPEPATWAMLIAGFGLVGVAARRRRPLAAAC